MKRIKIIKLLLTVTFAILASSNMMFAKHIAKTTYVNPPAPPHLVWRFDTRGSLNQDQNEIFNNGFTSYGESTNLAAHVTESSTIPDIFIATAERETFLTVEVAGQPSLLFNPRHGGYPPRLYLYTIRATSNFFGVQRSLVNNPDYATRLEYVIRRESEWVAVRNIPRVQIRDATEYTYDPINNRYIRGSTVQNRFYVRNVETHGSREPYQNVAYNPPRRVFNVVAGVGYNNTNVMGTSFCPQAPSSFKDSIVNYEIKGNCGDPLVLNLDHWPEELKAYKNYMLSNKLGYIKAWSHDEL